MLYNQTMFSLRLVSSSIRGISALASSQVNGQASTAAAVAPSSSQPKARLSYTTQVSQDQFARQLSISSVSQQATRSTKLNKISIAIDPEAEAQLPLKPKKPITPWILFVRERKDEILSRKDKMTAAELAVILAKEWKHIDKTKYEREYKQNHEEYMKLAERYEKSLTDEQRNILDLQKSLKRETKAAKMLRKTNPPILPRNPANLYCHERSKQDDFKEMLKFKKPAQVFSDIFKEYREMSDETKKRYIDMQEEDKARFQHEFLSWYEGVQNNENLTKAARDQANVMRDRLKSLNYI